MNRRAFIGSLAAILLIRRSGTPSASGSLGRLGKWFGPFPKTGVTTVLHGSHALITPTQAVLFATIDETHEQRINIFSQRYNS